jgi:hypothetical protein
MSLRTLLSLWFLGALATPPMPPCDVFAAGGTPCVAAHSLVRALYAKFTGPLYQVKRASDDTTRDIYVLSAGGFANAAAQDAFCKGTSCVIQRIFDQSPKGNHLDVAGPGHHVPHPDKPVDASRHQISIGGHTVYGARFEGYMGYRNDKTSGVAIGEEAQTMYMVVRGDHYNDECCFDYGNAEADNDDDGKGTMETLYFGSRVHREHHGGQGDGPWVSVDIEDGIWSTDKSNAPLPSIKHEFVTAMAKGKKDRFAIKAGNAQEGALHTVYEGARPNGYKTMKKQGAIVLGIGGDNSNRGIGTFYEGAITVGYSNIVADNMLQANIVAAGYGKRAESCTDWQPSPWCYSQLQRYCENYPCHREPYCENWPEMRAACKKTCRSCEHRVAEVIV